MEDKQINRKGVFVGGYVRGEYREKIVAVQKYLSEGSELDKRVTVTDALNFIIKHFDLNSIPKELPLTGAISLN